MNIEHLNPDGLIRRPALPWITEDCSQKVASVLTRSHRVVIDNIDSVIHTSLPS
jgi:hypothetical protein